MQHQTANAALAAIAIDLIVTEAAVAQQTKRIARVESKLRFISELWPGPSNGEIIGTERVQKKRHATAENRPQSGLDCAVWALVRVESWTIPSKIPTRITVVKGKGYGQQRRSAAHLGLEDSIPVEYTLGSFNHQKKLAVPISNQNRAIVNRSI